MIPTWVNDYIGKPWVAKARGPEAFDCWGLVHDVLRRHFGVATPSYADDYTQGAPQEELGHITDLVDEGKKNWPSVTPGEERAGDVVILRVKNHPIHIGVVVDALTMLHCIEGLGCCVEMYDSMRWRHRVFGIFRPPELVIA